jgi:DNA transformation protein and related proteins
MVREYVVRHSPDPIPMSVSESYRTFLLDQLGRAVDRVRMKSMFGGAGVYAGEFFFAIVDDDVLYLKVDDTNRPDFEARGMGPFRPFGEGGEVMQYYQLPEELLEDPDELKPWLEKAIGVAERKKKRRKTENSRPKTEDRRPKTRARKPEARKPEARKPNARKPKARKVAVRKPKSKSKPKRR